MIIKKITINYITLGVFIPNQNGEKLSFPKLYIFVVFAWSLIRSCFEIAIVFNAFPYLQ